MPALFFSSVNFIWGQHNHRDVGEAQFAGSLQPGMSGQYTGAGVDQNGVGKPKLADAGHYLRNLLGGVGARVARIGN